MASIGAEMGEHPLDLKIVCQQSRDAIMAIHAVLAKARVLARDNRFAQYAADMTKRVVDMEVAIHGLNNFTMVVEGALRYADR